MSNKAKYIYVCAPAGSGEENCEIIKRYGRYVMSQGDIPIIPHTMLFGIAEGRTELERAAALSAGIRMLKICDELWQFGEVETAGMKSEILFAQRECIPIKKIQFGNDFDELNIEWTKLLEFYQARYGRFSCAVADGVRQYLKAGLSPDLIRWAIETADERNAGWRYVQAILERCVAQRINTLAAVQAQKNIGKDQQMQRSYDLSEYERMLENDY